MYQPEKIIHFCDNNSVFPTNGIKREKTEEVSSDESHFVTWDMIKKGLAIGVNSVTKSLEKDNLMLVLVGAVFQSQEYQFCLLILLVKTLTCVHMLYSFAMNGAMNLTS
jgi:hypothetical protein